MRVYLLLITIFLFSCTKEKQQPEPPAPAMEYFNFNDVEIKVGDPGFSVDLNHDGRKDIAFFTLLVGDPLNQVDKHQFFVQSNIQVNLPVQPGEEIPVMSKGDAIPVSDFERYQWFELSAIVLVQKVISFTQPPVWQGHWKSAVQKYIPYQVVDAGKIFCGWIEISIDIPNERVVVHKAAISKEPGKAIKAGM